MDLGDEITRSKKPLCFAYIPDIVAYIKAVKSNRDGCTTRGKALFSV